MGAEILGGSVDSLEEAARNLRLRIEETAYRYEEARSPEEESEASVTKEGIRSLYSELRQQRLKAVLRGLGASAGSLLREFALGQDINLATMDLRLVPVVTGRVEASLFRLATLFWSVPVSSGFGRRMRYLVKDASNGKLAGILALGDPVFNLGVRDRAIGWTVHDRSERLNQMMDAYVLGAVPPYSLLMVAKVIALFLKSDDIRKDFDKKYRARVAVITGRKSSGDLVAITTSSSLGRSSIYNRVRIGPDKFLEPVGSTLGYGHFHIPPDLFKEMREFLGKVGHKYARGNRFGDGPNWKLRTTRAALEYLGLDREILQHGIRRETFICRLAENAFEVLRGDEGEPRFDQLKSVRELSSLGVRRWVQPRAEKRPEYQEWSSADLKRSLGL